MTQNTPRSSVTSRTIAVERATVERSRGWGQVEVHVAVLIEGLDLVASGFARLRGHRIAYVPPADGQFRHWRLSPGLSRSFRVDVAQLIGVVRDMMRDA